MIYALSFRNTSGQRWVLCLWFQKCVDCSEMFPLFLYQSVQPELIHIQGAPSFFWENVRLLSVPYSAKICDPIEIWNLINSILGLKKMSGLLALFRSLAQSVAWFYSEKHDILYKSSYVYISVHKFIIFKKSLIENWKKRSFFFLPFLPALL